MNTTNPYEAPRAALVEPGDSRPRSRWSVLRWLPFLYCLAIAAACLALCVYCLGSVGRYLTIESIRRHGPMSIRAVLIISLASLFLAGVGCFVALDWKRYRWRRAVIGTIGFMGLVRLLTWTVDSPWLFR